MTNDLTPSVQDPLAARGGGHATAAGVGFQAKLGSAFACQLLAERTVDRRLDLGDARVLSLRFETEAPVDDVLIETDKGGFIFGQAKTSVTLSNRADSDLGKTAEQAVQLWLATATGQSKRGWDRPLQPDKDRLLLAIGQGSAATVSADLASALEAVRASATAPLTQAQRHALDVLMAHLKRAWRQIEGQSFSDDALQPLLKLIAVITFDFDGPDRTSATESVAHVLANTTDANAAFDILTRRCTELMTKRLGSDAPQFAL